MSTNVKMSELKKRALLAKQRLRMGYWQAMEDEKKRALEEIGSSTNSVKLVKELQQKKFERDLNTTLGSTQAIQDEILFQKVCKMLDENENITNPIGMLVEHSVYDNLDEQGKQRYILELSKKYRELQDRYYKERLSKTV